jgi:hypothetical protein
MLLKLENYGVKRKSLTWFKSYLTDKTQKCLVNGQLSNAVPMTYGVPQGSNLEPLLFLVYINDLPNCLNHTTPRMFADDTSVSYASNSVEELKNIMNSDLKNLNSWLTTNRLKDIGNQNFYFLYLIDILTEYLISYFCPFVAFSC